MTAIFKVEGMHCEGCAGRVKRIVEAKAPGTIADVDLNTGLVTVVGESAMIDIAAVISKAGYPAVRQD